MGSARRDGGLASLIRETHAQAPPYRRLERGRAEYPAVLEQLRQPPARLCVWGAALPGSERAVAIVGARAATPYGRGVARRLARDLAAQGCAVVSGLAHGIDAAAHEGALEAVGVTVAVIASSFHRLTPPDHAALAHRVCGTGAVVSEVEEGGPFGPGAFVKRNRLIAALSAATVVVEAGSTSGALATAAVARELGRPVFAVPGDVDRTASQGTLALLRNGARVCGDAGDVLAVLPARPAAANDPAARLLAALGAAPAPVEALAELAGLAPEVALAQLLTFAWSGLAESHPGGRWSRRA